MEELIGANTQGGALKGTRANLKEAIELVLAANRALAAEDLAGVEVIRQPSQMEAMSRRRRERLNVPKALKDGRSL